MQYLLVVGRGTCFEKEISPGPDKFADGIENTILVVEVIDDLGVVWTNPADLEVRQAIEQRPFATWNDDGFLALLANGEVVQVTPSAGDEQLWAMLTIAGGEELVVKEFLNSRSDAKIASATPTTNDDRTSDSDKPWAGGGNTPSNQLGSVIGVTTDRRVEDSPRRTDAPTSAKTPVPTPEQQREAMEIVKQLYLSRYQEAENDKEKAEIAEEMLDQSSKTGSDVAGQYVMLTTAQRIALEHNDLETAKSCLDKLVDEFEVDAFDMKVALLRKSSSQTTESSFDTRLMDEARQLMEEAVERDEYQAADDMGQVAIAAARRLADKEEVAAITRRQRDISRMEAAYRRVRQAIAEHDPASSNPTMSEMVGRYFCLMKGDWERGLPYLARGDDLVLKRLAQRELDEPADSANQLALADAWWDAIDDATSLEETQIRRRALWWYEAALPELPQGLAKLKAELRIKELKKADS